MANFMLCEFNTIILKRHLDRKKQNKTTSSRGPKTQCQKVKPAQNNDVHFLNEKLLIKLSFVLQTFLFRYFLLTPLSKKPSKHFMTMKTSVGPYQFRMKLKKRLHQFCKTIVNKARQVCSFSFLYLVYQRAEAGWNTRDLLEQRSADFSVKVPRAHTLGFIGQEKKGQIQYGVNYMTREHPHHHHHHQFPWMRVGGQLCTHLPSAKHILLRKKPPAGESVEELNYTGLEENRV